MAETAQSMPALRYLALGDSYTIGTGTAGPGEAFPAHLGRLARERLGAGLEVVNPSVNGYATTEVIRDELPLLVPVRPHLVSILVGANDLARGWSREVYLRGLREIYDAIASAVPDPAAVLAVTMPDWSLAPAASGFGEPTELGAEIEERNRLAIAEALGRGFQIFDLGPLSRRFGTAGLGPDELHPTAEQQEAWASAIWDAAGAGWVAAALARIAPSGVEPRRTVRSTAFGEVGEHLDYGTYLRVPELLRLQSPRTRHHDELLFITIHQAYELWFKLQLHELEAARDAMLTGDLPAARWYLRRIAAIGRLLVHQVDILDTMAPQDFLLFRAELAPASGFQSVQFREIEFLAGLKDPGYLDRLDLRPADRARLERRLREPSLRDGWQRALHDGGSPPLEELYADRRRHQELFEVAEDLLDVDQQLTAWRERHVTMVERQIGTKPGTGGSAGAAYLRTTLGKRCFPDLWAARSEIAASPGS